MAVLNDAGDGAGARQVGDRLFDPAVCFTNWVEFTDIAIGLGGHGVTVRSEARARRGDREPRQPRPTRSTKSDPDNGARRLSKHLTRSPPTCPHTFAARDSTDPPSAHSRARSRMQPQRLADDSRGGRIEIPPAAYCLGTLSREQDAPRSRKRQRGAHQRPRSTSSR